MFLKKLSLINFRNYSTLNLTFDGRPTILLGNNAVGKSNLLESIYFLSTTKSSRVETEDELLKEGESICRVEGTINEHLGSTDTSDTPGVSTKVASGPHTGSERDVKGEVLEITMQNIDSQFSKKVKVNGVPRRVVEFVGNLPAVIFYPSDINMVTGPPALRRWHLDLGLAQVDSEYKRSLTFYEQVLTNRNRVLKRIRDGEGRVDELIYWNMELIKEGKLISNKRKVFFDSINIFIEGNPLGNFRFKYLQTELSEEKLDEYGGKEIAAAVTLIGPHRDDFRIVILDNKNTPGVNKERDLAHFGSRGEQRTATLAFKLAQLEYMAHVLGKRPILLLDDVFSELDAQHRAHVVEVVGRQQTIIATVELEHIPKKFLDEARILRVEDGTIAEAK